MHDSGYIALWRRQSIYRDRKRWETGRGWVWERVESAERQRTFKYPLLYSDGSYISFYNLQSPRTYNILNEL